MKIRKLLSHKAIFIYGASIIILVAIFKLAIYALHGSLEFDGATTNGAFQLLNPLRRISDGEVIGRDFNFFHGPLLPYIHYPVFKLLGSSIFASEMSRYIISPIIFIITTFLFMYIATKRKIPAFAGAAVVLVIALCFYESIVVPGNALLGVRSAMPIFMACLIMHQSKLERHELKIKRVRISYFSLLSGLILSVCLVSGTEFGLAAVVSYILVSLIQTGRTLKIKVTTIALTIAATSVLTFFIILLVSQGHPWQVAVYMFRDVPADQFWYFGVGPNTFLYTGNVFEVLWRDQYIRPAYVLFLFALLSVYFYKKLLGRTDIYYSFIFALCVGFVSQVSMLGYYIYTQTFSLARLSTLVLVLSMILIFLKLAHKEEIALEIRGKRRVLDMNIFKFSISVLFLLAALSFAATHITTIKNLYNVRAIVSQAHDRVQGSGQRYSSSWLDNLNQIMPIIQKDNSYPIAQFNSDTYVDGINMNDGSIALSGHVDTLRPGDEVYLSKSGRKVVNSIRYGAGITHIKLYKGDELSKEDGYPKKMVIARDVTANSGTLWSTYTGIIDYSKGTLNPSSDGADYIIHALGANKREKYIEDFSLIRPEYVLTMQRPSLVFEEWLQLSSWSFYDKLISNYTVVGGSSSYVLWQRHSDTWQRGNERKWEQLKSTENKLYLPHIESIQDRRLGVVRVEYEFDSASKNPRIYDKTTRWLLQPQGPAFTAHLPASMPPYERMIEFPVVVSETSSQKENTINLQSFNILPFSTQVNIISAEISWIDGLSSETNRALTR